MSNSKEFAIPSSLTMRFFDEDNAGIFEHEDHAGIAAPSPITGHHFYGIIQNYPLPSKFIVGPFVARSSNIWEAFRKLRPGINPDDVYCEFDNPTGCGIVPQNLDHFIDLVTAPVTVSELPPTNESGRADWWKNAEDGE